MYIKQSPYVPFGLFRWMVSWAVPNFWDEILRNLKGPWASFIFLLATLKCCNPPPSDFVSKIIETPIKRNHSSFLLLRHHWWRGNLLWEPKKWWRFRKWRSLPANLEGPFQLQTLSFPGREIVLFGVDASFLCSWELKQIIFWTIEKKWLHHFKLRQFGRISGTCRTILGVT